MPIRLNLGCGNYPKSKDEGWINIDKYHTEGGDIVCMDVEKLEYPNNYADEIWAQMIIEHIEWGKSRDVILEWGRVIKPGGKITIATNNMDVMCREWLQKGKGYRGMLRGIYGSQGDPGNYHKSGFDFKYLKELLTEAGFSKISLIPPDSQYHLWVEAIK